MRRSGGYLNCRRAGGSGSPPKAGGSTQRERPPCFSSSATPASASTRVRELQRSSIPHLYQQRHRRCKNVTGTCHQKTIYIIRLTVAVDVSILKTGITNRLGKKPKEDEIMHGDHEHTHAHGHEHAHAHTHEHVHGDAKHTHEHTHAHAHEHVHEHKHEHEHSGDSLAHTHDHAGDHGTHDHAHTGHECESHTHSH
jgi:hypothetical protein